MNDRYVCSVLYNLRVSSYVDRYMVHEGRRQSMSKKDLKGEEIHVEKVRAV